MLSDTYLNKFIVAAMGSLPIECFVEKLRQCYIVKVVLEVILSAWIIDRSFYYETIHFLSSDSFV
ncbi:hypothetical protein VDIAB_250363 [Vibrio diabolicus]|nr:hypothetical protein VDIAB_250363 [Vibrio diabolicus]